MSDLRLGQGAGSIFHHLSSSRSGPGPGPSPAPGHAPVGGAPPPLPPPPAATPGSAPPAPSSASSAPSSSSLPTLAIAHLDPDPGPGDPSAVKTLHGVFCIPNNDDSRIQELQSSYSTYRESSISTNPKPGGRLAIHTAFTLPYRPNASSRSNLSEYKCSVCFLDQ